MANDRRVIIELIQRVLAVASSRRVPVEVILRVIDVANGCRVFTVAKHYTYGLHRS